MIILLALLYLNQLKNTNKHFHDRISSVVQSYWLKKSPPRRGQITEWSMGSQHPLPLLHEEGCGREASRSRESLWWQAAREPGRDLSPTTTVNAFRQELGWAWERSLSMRWHLDFTLRSLSRETSQCLPGFWSTELQVNKQMIPRGRKSQLSRQVDWVVMGGRGGLVALSLSLIPKWTWSLPHGPARRNFYLNC